MNTTTETLPREAIFEPDGHLTEVALTCVSDGEMDLVPAAALAHLDGCEHCTRLLGEAALLSVAAEEALVSGAPELSTALVTMGETPKPPAQPAPATATALQPVMPLAPAEPPSRIRRPFPAAAIGAALLIALVTTGPSLIESVRGVPSAISTTASTLPFMFRMVSALVRVPMGQGPAALFFKCASALVLAAIGLQVARVTSRARSLQEGGV